MDQSSEPLSVLGKKTRADSFKLGMRKFATGVTLVTSAINGRRAGLIATAVSSVSTSPPTLLVCVNKTASAHDIIDQSGIFGVNLLSAGDVELVDIFSTSARRPERFVSGEWRTLITGAPVLATALASFDCCVVRQLAYETHTIFLGEVIEVEIVEHDVDPLIYMGSAFRRIERAA